MRADVAVVGAGITGLTAALALKRAGRRVVVLDARQFKNSESCRTTAHLTEVLDTRFATLLARFGLEKTKLIIEGQRHAIEQIESWVNEQRIRCGFERLPGYLFAAPDDRSQQRILDAEADAVVKLGYGDIRIREIAAPFAVAGALRFERQAQFRPGAYLAGLESAIPGNGSLVVRGVSVQAIEDGGGDGPCRVSTSGGDIVADHVIVATHVPLAGHSPVHSRLFAYRSYAIAAPVRQPLGALLWDLSDPYHHVRTVRIASRHHIVVGGGDHRVGAPTDTRQALAELVSYARDHFGPLEVTHRWSGQIIETADGLPYVGPDAPGKRVLFATGLSGNGFTNGTLAGLVLADAIRSRHNRWAEMMAPDRRASLALMSRRVGRDLVAARRRLRDRLRSRSGRLVDLEPRSATVIRQAGETLAVYRRSSGALRALAGTCPRDRGTVQWNRAEKSWDCPACGSRFNLAGDVLNGPAATGLGRRVVSDPEPAFEPRAETKRASGEDDASLSSKPRAPEASRLGALRALIVAPFARRLLIGRDATDASPLASEPPQEAAST